MAQDWDTTKTPARPAHEALEETGEEVTEQQKMDRVAMESAKRSQNRIHSDETNVPGSSPFTK